MQEMTGYFEVLYFSEAERFLDQLDKKARKKILYNIHKARYTLDPRLFKKISNEIWEFRTRYGRIQYRLFAFWDKRNETETLVFATNGFIKKSKKIPRYEIKVAIKIRESYYRYRKNDEN